MRKVIMVAIILVAMLALMLPATVGAAPQDIKGGFLVKFAHGVTQNEIAQMHQEAEAEVVSFIPQIGLYIVKTANGNAYLNSKVKYVEPNHIYRVFEIPDDPDLALQWGLDKIRATEAWNITQGNPDILIAILDTGIDLNHPDLEGKIAVSVDFSGSRNFDDVYGHGTHVAGIAAAVTGNGIGVAGVGYDSGLMNVKVIGDSGQGTWSAAAQGIVWAADNGADIINMSFGGEDYSSAVEDAINYAWSQGVLLVASAGNDPDTAPNYPAYYTNCMAVAATDLSDNLAQFSTHGSWVDVAAPGVSIYSTMPDGYGCNSGTSMAAPHVAGIAGLVFTTTVDSNSDDCINDEVRGKIEYTSVDIAIDVAHGRVDAYEAVTVLDAPPVPPVPPPSMWVSVIHFTPPVKKGPIIIQIFTTFGPFGIEGTQATISLTRGKNQGKGAVDTLSGVSEPNGYVYWYVKKSKSYTVTITSLTHDKFIWDKTRGVISATYTL